ncbi:amino acid permease [Streptomyces bathyalis]|uniref:Amino acid permease n=1 Tax=Streptomyces bathyalis TaxID=2710756 RepID=A0A7T1TBA4_9ACTN|nr:amino acid permease [Streptomyces bathyalis]QPP09824.1 amino acid permease [Streptomyces bathyalis]
MSVLDKPGPRTGVFRRQPITDDSGGGESSGLKRTLGLWQLTAIGLGAIIGAGIFTLAGTVANGTAGPAVSLSFILAGVASAAAALSYAEFAGLIPRSGSAYTYSYAVLGELVAWLIGWDLLLEYTAIVAVVAIGVSGYFSFLLEGLGVDLPAWMLGAPGTGDGHRIDLFAALLCLLIAWLLNRGMKTSARVETVLVFVKIAIVIAVIVVGAFYVNSGNLTPFLPYGFGGVVTGAATVFFAVFGYDAMSTAAEESKDAQRNLPKAIVLSLAIAMVLYLLACAVLTGMQHYNKIDAESPFATVFQSVGLPVFADIIAIGAIVGILTVLFSFMLGASRVWFAISRDGLLPGWFAKVHPRTEVPHRPTWIIGIVSACIAGLMPIAEAAELTNIGILLAFVVVSAAVIVLRYRSPELPRTFRCPGMPLVPLVGIGFSLWLVAQLQTMTFIRFLIWFALGLAVYGVYGYRHSKLGQGAGKAGGAGGPSQPATAAGSGADAAPKGGDS